jgi:hypothetical protein
MKYQIQTLDTEDEHLFKLHYNGPTYYRALVDVSDMLRRKYKYGPNQVDPWELYRAFNNILLDYNINLWVE